jgi:hypothetical protein
VPRGDTPRYLAVALSRRVGRLLTLADLGLPSPAKAESDTIGLSLGSDPLDALLPMWRYELDRRRFLSASAYSVAAASLPLSHVQDIAARTQVARTGHTVGMAEVAAVRDMIHAFSKMDKRHGGQHGRSALVTYLRDDIAPLCRARFRSDNVRRQMLSAASRGVHLLGWKSYDAGQGLAQRYYLQSYALAAESGLRGHDGFVMRTMAMQGLKLHRPEHCLGLAETALNRAKGRVDAQTEALFRVVHAHTLAKSGKHRAALAEAEHARTLLTGAPGDEVPFWALAWGPLAASVYSRTAKVHETVGDYRAAAEQCALAATARPAHTYARIVALDLVAGAEMHLKRGNIEQACLTWHKAIDHMDGVRSVRTRKAVSRMRSDLARFRTRGLRCVAELDERGRDFLADS